MLLFVLIHKIGDTMANLMIRDLLVGLGFTNDEILFVRRRVGFFALLAGIFVGGMLYAQLGMKRSVLVSLVLMAISNLSFAALAAAGHINAGMACGRSASRISPAASAASVVAYLSALCNLRYHRDQFALLSARGEHRRAVPHRHHRRRADREHGLRQLLPADDAHRAARRVPLLPTC